MAFLLHISDFLCNFARYSYEKAYRYRKSAIISTKRIDIESADISGRRIARTNTGEKSTNTYCRIAVRSERLWAAVWGMAYVVGMGSVCVCMRRGTSR